MKSNKFEEDGRKKGKFEHEEIELSTFLYIVHTLGLELSIDDYPRFETTLSNQ